jgi:hypothetical protein
MKGKVRGRQLPPPPPVCVAWYVGVINKAVEAFGLELGRLLNLERVVQQ